MFAVFKLIFTWVAFIIFWILCLYMLSNLKNSYSYKKKNKVDFYEGMKNVVFKPKLFEFIKWVTVDIRRRIKNGKTFDEYGLTMYCGRQGDGKTVSMVEYLEWIRQEYPKAMIITNFFYEYESQPMKSWKDFLTIRNGTDGIVFAIDEIHQEYNSRAWEDFPDDLLSEISYQRKQRIKIIASSQVYADVVIQLRRQCFDVVECSTLGRRWTFQKCYDAREYNKIIDKPVLASQKLNPKWKKSFIQSDRFRCLFDTNKKAQRLEKTEMLPRSKRAASAPGGVSYL